MNSGNMSRSPEYLGTTFVEYGGPALGSSLCRITANLHCGHSPVQKAVFLPYWERFSLSAWPTHHIHLAYYELYPYVNHFNLVK